jgi:hypothetical protein
MMMRSPWVGWKPEFLLDGNSALVFKLGWSVPPLTVAVVPELLRPRMLTRDAWWWESPAGARGRLRAWIFCRYSLLRKRL